MPPTLTLPKKTTLIAGVGEVHASLVIKRQPLALSLVRKQVMQVLVSTWARTEILGPTGTERRYPVRDRVSDRVGRRRSSLQTAAHSWDVDSKGIASSFVQSTDRHRMFSCNDHQNAAKESLWVHGASG